MVALDDVRRWEPDGVARTVDDLGVGVQALVGLQDELAGVATVPSWAGWSADAAGANAQRLADRLEEAAAGAAAVRRASEAGAGLVRELRERIRRADERAAAEGLAVAPDGAITDRVPPASPIVAPPGSPPGVVAQADQANRDATAAAARRADVAQELRDEYTAILVAAEDFDVRFSAQLVAATRGEISPDELVGSARASTPPGLEAAARTGAVAGDVFAPVATAPQLTDSPEAIADWWSNRLNPAQREVALRDPAMWRLLGDTPTLPPVVRERAQHDGQGAAYRRTVGHDPTTPQQWTTAAMLYPRTGAKSAADPDAHIKLVQIMKVPGQGVVQGGAFISSAEVSAMPPFTGDPRATPGGMHQGDNRGFEPNAAAARARVGMAVDYENGLVVVRQNPTHSTDGTEVAVGEPKVGVEQNAAGEVRTRVDAANPLTPGPNELPRGAGWTVRGDVIVSPGQDGGPATANGLVSQYPSWELYQQGPEGQSTPIVERPQATTDIDGPFLNLPLDTVPVGPDPDRFDDWMENNHPDQQPDPGERYIEEPLIPGTPLGDPWWNYDLPQTPDPGVSPDGTPQVPLTGGAS